MEEEKLEGLEPSPPQQEEHKSGYIASFDDWVAAGKDPDMFKGKKAFEKDGELIDTVSYLKRRDKEREDMVKKMMENQDKLLLKVKEDTLKEFRSQLKDAASIGDTSKVEELTDKISEAQYEVKQIQTNQVSQQNNVPYEYQDFISKHPWFNGPGKDDRRKTSFAVTEEALVREENPNLPLRDVLNLVEQRIEERFSPRESKKINPSVESSGEIPSKSKNYVSVQDLPHNYQQAIKYYQKIMGDNFDVKKYVSDLKEIGAIK